MKKNKLANALLVVVVAACIIGAAWYFWPSSTSPLPATTGTTISGNTSGTIGITGTTGTTGTTGSTDCSFVKECNKDDNYCIDNACALCGQTPLQNFPYCDVRRSNTSTIASVWCCKNHPQ